MPLRRLAERMSGLLLLCACCLLPVSATVPPTVGQALRSYGVGTQESDLVLALRDVRPMVRALASVELSSRKAVGTLPAIMDAAFREQQAFVRAQMLGAALDLGSPAAPDGLKEICQSPARRGDARIMAARALFSVGDHGCFRAVADLMSPSEKEEDRVAAWYLLAQLHDRTREETDVVLWGLIPAVYEADGSIRSEACTGLRMLGDPLAAEPLRTAISAERDDAVRMEMQADLALLLRR